MEKICGENMWKHYVFAGFQGWSPPGWHQIGALTESRRVSESSIAVHSAPERSMVAFLRAGGAAGRGQRPLDFVMFATPLARNLRNRGSDGIVFRTCSVSFCPMLFPDIFYFVHPSGLHFGGPWPYYLAPLFHKMFDGFGEPGDRGFDPPP